MTRLPPKVLAPFGFVGAQKAFADASSAAAPTGKPGLSALLGEGRAGSEPTRLLAAAFRLARAPRGDGGLVLDLPGWRTSESVGAPLRAYLRWLGYEARPWGLGRNAGDPERDADMLSEQIERLSHDTGQPVSLVGWSLGGVVAREVARRLPGSVERVITYGTPVVGGPTYTAAARSYGKAQCERAAAIIEKLDADDPIQVPITAIFTRADGVVSWTACIDHVSPLVDHVEVRSTHLGLGFDPDVWTVVAERLATPLPKAATTGARLVTV